MFEHKDQAVEPEGEKETGEKSHKKDEPNIEVRQGEDKVGPNDYINEDGSVTRNVGQTN